MVHVLAGCRTVLTQGRYRWRRFKMLVALADMFEQERGKKPQPRQPLLTIMSFAEEGQKSAIRNRLYSTLRDRNSGQTRGGKCALHRRYYPDIFTQSWEGRKAILVEVTVLWEHQVQTAAPGLSGQRVRWDVEELNQFGI